MDWVIIFAMLVAAASIAAFALSIQRIISPYSGRQTATMRRKLAAFADMRKPEEPANLGWSGPQQLGLFASIISRFSFNERLKRLIERSASKRSVDQLVQLILVIILSVFCLGWIITGSTFVALLFAGMAGSIPLVNLGIKAEKRRRMFEVQLPDALDFMSRALRAGHGLTTAFQIVGEEMSAPISEEFSLAFEEINFGNSFQDALSKMPDRIDSPDLSFFVVGVLIQRETGGNLSDLLRSLSNTVRERLKLQGKVRTLSAEGKFAGILLGVMPFALAGILTLLNPVYMGALWSTPTGHRWVAIGATMMGLGFAWMWKIAQIKV